MLTPAGPQANPVSGGTCARRSLGVVPMAAEAWILTGLGTNNPARVFMMVGNGAGAMWPNNATVNMVSVTVPAPRSAADRARP